jgi:hypothetical protein
MNQKKGSNGKTRRAYIPYAVAQDTHTRIHTLQLWSRTGTCRGIAYARIEAFDFDASGAIILRLPDPWYPIALKGLRLAELYDLLCERRVQRVQEWGESFTEVLPDQPCIQAIDVVLTDT